MKLNIISIVIFIIVMAITGKAFPADAAPKTVSPETFVAKYGDKTMNVFAVKSVSDGLDNDSYLLDLHWVGGDDLQVEVNTMVPNIVSAIPAKVLMDTAVAAHAPFRQIDGYEGGLSPLMVQIFPIKTGDGHVQLVPIFTLIDRVLIHGGFDGYVADESETLFWSKSDDSDSRAYLLLLSMIHLRTIERVANNVGHKVALKLPVNDLGGLGAIGHYVAALMSVTK